MEIFIKKPKEFPLKGTPLCAMGDRKGENRDSTPSFRAIGFADAQDIKSSKKAIVLHSGGMDSSLCLAVAIEEWGREQILSLSLRYGQSHNREPSKPLEFAKIGKWIIPKSA